MGPIAGFFKMEMGNSETLCEGKEARGKRPCINGTQPGGRQGLAGGRDGEQLLTEFGVSFWSDANVWGWRLHNTVNVLSYHFIAHFKVVDLCYTQLAVISC